MSMIRKSWYLECLRRMINKVNEKLQEFSAGDFIEKGDGDGGRTYYRIKSIKVCEYSEKEAGFFSSARIDILQEPSMIVEPVAYKAIYSKEYESLKGKASENIISFHKGGKDGYANDRVSAPYIEPFCEWWEVSSWEGTGRIKMWEGVRLLVNEDVVEVLNGVKQTQEKREREKERQRKEKLDKERRSEQITQKDIDELLRSIQ